jgi:hypothetical protein
VIGTIPVASNQIIDKRPVGAIHTIPFQDTKSVATTPIGKSPSEKEKKVQENRDK